MGSHLYTEPVALSLPRFGASETSVDAGVCPVQTALAGGVGPPAAVRLKPVQRQPAAPCRPVASLAAGPAGGGGPANSR